jgi:hypothetical protein
MKFMYRSERVLFRPALRDTLGWMAHWVVSRSRLRMRHSELSTNNWFKTTNDSRG